MAQRATSVLCQSSVGLERAIGEKGDTVPSSTNGNCRAEQRSDWNRNSNFLVTCVGMLDAITRYPIILDKRSVRNMCCKFLCLKGYEAFSP